MRICFDLDGVLFESDSGYINSSPIPEAVQLLNKLHKEGHTIIIYTARRMKTHNGNIGKVNASIAYETLRRLDECGIHYDEIYFGKPAADIYIDDKAINGKDIKSVKGKLDELLNNTSTV